MYPYGDGLPPSVRIANELLTQRALADGQRERAERAAAQRTDTPGTRSAPTQYMTPTSPRFASQRVTRDIRPARPFHPSPPRAWRVWLLRALMALVWLTFFGALLVLMSQLVVSDLPTLPALGILLLMGVAGMLMTYVGIPALYRWLCWRALAWR